MAIWSRVGKWEDWLCWILFGLGSTLWCLTATTRLGVTFDESHYVPSGLAGWRDGTCDRLVVWGTMPLPIDVQTFPLYLAERISGTPYGQDLWEVLPYARAGNLVFWNLLLIHGWLLGRWLGGPWVGRLSLAFLATDPSLLGHATVATTDLSVAALGMTLTFHTLAGWHASWPRRILLPGVLYGFLALAKASGILFGLVIVITIGVWMLRSDPSRSLVRKCANIVVRTLLIGLLAALVSNLYCGFDKTSTGPVQQLLAKLPPDDPWRPLLERIARWPVVPKAAAAVAFQARHNDEGRGVYLLGTWHAEPVWYANLVVLACKIPTATLLGLVCVLVRPRALASMPMFLVGMLLLASLESRVQLGIRLLLSITMFLHIALAVAFSRAWPGRRWWLAWVIVASNGAECLRVWPDGISYQNQWAGGPHDAYKRLADSNVDWGQGLPELDRWHAAQGRPALAVWYFGTDPRLHQMPVRPVALEHAQYASEEEMLADLGPTLLAVGHTMQYQSPDDTPQKQMTLAWLRRQVPIARTRTFTLYDLRFAR